MPRAPHFHRCLLLTVVWLLTAAGAQAAGSVEEVYIYKQTGSLRVEMHAGDLLDERTASTIDSGLPGTCVYYLRLEDQNESLVAEQFLEFSLQLNLWENLYFLSAPTGQLVYETLAAADSAWSHLYAVDVCPLARLERERAYRVQVQIAVQPLAPEVRERLSKYVSSNSSRSREELAVDLSALLGRLLGGSGSAGDQARFTSDLFHIGDLEERP